MGTLDLNSYRPGPGTRRGLAPGALLQFTTRWSVVHGPRDAALEHLYRMYGDALRRYVVGALTRGDFSPLRADQAEDLVHDFMVRLARRDWFASADRERGSFRAYLVGALRLFLSDRRKQGVRRLRIVRVLYMDAGIPDLEAPDPLERRLERDWARATVHTVLERIEKRNTTWHAALVADLRRVDEPDRVLAERLQWTEAKFRTALKRGRRAFRDVFVAIERRHARALRDRQ